MLLVLPSFLSFVVVCGLKLFDWYVNRVRRVSERGERTKLTDGLMQAYKHDELEVIESRLKPAVLEAYEQHISTILERYQMFYRHFERLRIVKSQKILFPRIST